MGEICSQMKLKQNKILHAALSPQKDDFITHNFIVDNDRSARIRIESDTMNATLRKAIEFGVPVLMCIILVCRALQNLPCVHALF